MTDRPPLYYEFGRFRVDIRRRRLLRDGTPVSLTPKAFSLLLAMVEEAGKQLSKDDLIGKVWPDAVASEANLSVNVATLRKALGEGPRDNRFIATIPLQGYRFVGRVRPVLEDDDPESAPEPGRIRRLAVLPFRVLGEAGEDGIGYLGLGLTDTLITRLSRVRELSLPATGTVERFAADVPEPVEAARELGVDAVLAGTIQRRDGGFQVAVQLVNGFSGTLAWGETFVDVGGDVHRLERRIVGELCRFLRFRDCSAADDMAENVSTANPEAFQIYLKGRFLASRFDPRSLFESVRCFQTAIDRDPGFALAHSALGQAYFTLWHYGVLPTDPAIPTAEGAIRRALELEPDSAAARVVLGHITLMYHWNWPEAEDHYLRAIELEPNSAVGHHNYVYLLMTAGRFEEALIRIRHAQQLDPSSLLINTRVGAVHYYARRYRAALAQFQTTLELDPNHFWAGFLTGVTQAQLGEFDRSLDRFSAISRHYGEISMVVGFTSYVHGRLGNADATRAGLVALKRMAGRSFVHPYNFAIAYLGIGDDDRAMDWLERAIEQRFGYLTYLHVEPFWDRLREHERFRELVRRVGAPPIRD